MKVIRMKKLLVLGIILLFIGISIAPSVTSIEFSKTQTLNSDDLVEIDVQICKYNGVESNNKFITKEQDKKLDILFENQKEKLFNSKSTQETTEIHKEMIKSLYELGIISSEDKDSILSDIYGDNSKLSKINILKNILKYKSLFPTRIFDYKSSGDIKLFNAFCLVSYKSTYTWASDYLISSFFQRVGFGLDWESDNGGSGYSRSDGYINTDGIFGIKNYEGRLKGGFGRFGAEPIHPRLLSNQYHAGILFFHGVFVNKKALSKSYGEGRALLVRII